MNFDPKVVRRALMVAKDIATKIDPGFAVHNLPMPPEGVPLERAKGGEVKNVLPVGSPERSQNLREWLGNSFLHDEGNPRTYYHGTSKDKPFTGFKVGRHGAWFTSDPKDASMYAEANDSMSSRFEGGRFVPQNTASRVMPVYLKASNPFLGEFPEKYKNVENYKKAQSEWFDELRANGYDSWIPRSQEGSLAVMLEGPHQVKSAIGNVGTFDPTSPDIAKAEGGEVEAAGMGINVRSDNKAGIRYADEIVDGNKKYETRDSDSLRPYVGKRVAIVRTGEGPAKAIGEVTVGEPIVADRDMFHKMRPHYLVPAGSAFDIKPGSQKYLYPMHDPMRFDTEKGVGAGIIARKVLSKAEGGAVDDEMQARNLNPMGMYSAAAEAARNLPQERGTPQQMLATMKGVKPDELRWSGVQDKFAGQKTVTRDELAQHFEQRMPPLRENVRVESATEGPDAKYGQYTLPGGQNYREVVMHMRPEDVEQTYPGEKMSYKSSHWQEPNVVAHLRLKDREFAPAKKPPKPDTQANIMMNTPLDPSGQALRPVDAWSTPTPGLVVTKSLESDEKGQYRVTHLGTGLNATGGNAYPFHQAMDAAKRLGEVWDGWTQDPDTVKAWAKDNGKLAREALKKASNPFAKKILHIEELQSDWAQQGRDAGFRNAAALEKAKAEMDKWKAEMAKEYATSLHNRLSSGQPLQPFEKEEILQGHYQDLNSIRNYFERNEFNVVEQPLENDEHGLFLNHKDGDPVDEDELIKNLGSSALYDLSRMRKSFYEINNFDKKAKEDPEFRDHIINLHVAGLSPQELALHFGQRAIEKTEELEKAVVAGAGHDEGPYVTSTNQWTDLGLKRALVEAARGGYDKLIWTPGEAQVDRYKLSNFIDSLEYKKSDDGTYHLMGSRNGRGILSEKATEKELPNVVGREMAKKIMEGHGEPKDPNRPDESSRMIRGLDLNVGGKGMREYYNSILPRRLMALAQEHDPEAQIKPLKSATGKIKNLPSLDITPRMRDSILKRGFKAFKRGGAVQGHLFHHHDEPKSIEVPVMDRERAIRRALMIAKKDGGALTGDQPEQAPQANITSTSNPKRILVNAEGKGGVRGIVVPKHMWEGTDKASGMRDINKARAEVYGAENRDPLTIGQIGKVHKQTLDDHFAKPVDQQIAAEKAALQRLQQARHINKGADTLDESEKLDTVRHETDEKGRTYVAYGSKGIAGHALYTSGYGPNQKQVVLNTCPGQTTGCGGGVGPGGIVDTMRGTCFAPNAESQYVNAAVRRACHAQAKHDPAMTSDWILAHTGALRNAALRADKNDQVVLFRPNIVDESDTSSRYAISNLNKQRTAEDKPAIVANSYGKTNELHDPENGYHVTYSNAGPKTKLGYSVSENISRDKQRARSTISATDAAGRDFQNEQGNNTPPKNSYMVTDVKRGSDLNKEMEKAIKYAKYWSTGRMPNELSPQEMAEGPEGHFDGEGNPTTPDEAHFGHTTLNGRRYDYQKQHILHPRLVNVPERKKNKETGKTELIEHLIPTDSRFKDNEYLPKDRFMTKNGKEAGAILMTTPTTSTSNLGHQTSFTHNVNDDHIDYAKQNNGEYQIDPPEAQEASAGREYVPPQEIKFRADGGAVDGEYITDDLAGFPERSFAVQMHNAHRHEEYNDDHHHPRRPINNAVAPNVDRALQLTSRMGILPGMIPPYGRR